MHLRTAGRGSRTMSRTAQIPVTDPDGVQGVLVSSSRFLDNDRERLLRLSDGTELMISRDLLAPESDGTYRLTVPLRQLLKPAPSERSEVSPRDAGADLVIPVLEEQIRTEARRTETGRVLINKRVEEREVLV